MTASGAAAPPDPALPAADADGDWVVSLETRADQPPLRPRETLHVGSTPLVVGSIEAALGERLVAAGMPLARVADGWTVGGPANESLARIARWLHANGFGGRWREELLDVTDVQGAHHAAVERAVVRPLGIATHAVHLVGRTPDGALWVQQRALDKATDPGLWDTLMGGLVAAGESIADTLRRETEEEAGLNVAALDDLAPVDRFSVRRPVADGYMIEHITIFEAVVPHGVVPDNRDGEVARFECLAPAVVLERLHAGAFTLEAALILVGALRRRCSLAWPQATPLVGARRIP